MEVLEALLKLKSEFVFGLQNQIDVRRSTQKTWMWMAMTISSLRQRHAAWQHSAMLCKVCHTVSHLPWKALRQWPSWRPMDSTAALQTSPNLWGAWGTPNMFPALRPEDS